MSITVGLFELLGYLVPGATVVAVAALVFPQVRVNVGDGSVVQVAYLLASYVAGHALTIVSRVLTWLRSKLLGHPRRSYSFFPQLEEMLSEAFGKQLGPAEEYHMSLALAIEQSPRSADRIDRYFALVLLSRNLVCAMLASAVLVGWTGHYWWAVLGALLAGLFAFQFVRFEETLRHTVFRTAFLALTMRPLARPRTELSE